MARIKFTMMNKSETNSPRNHACLVGFSHVILKVVTSIQYSHR